MTLKGYQRPARYFQMSENVERRYKERRLTQFAVTATSWLLFGFWSIFFPKRHPSLPPNGFWISSCSRDFFSFFSIYKIVYVWKFMSFECGFQRECGTTWKMCSDNAHYPNLMPIILFIDFTCTVVTGNKEEFSIWMCAKLNIFLSDIFSYNYQKIEFNIIFFMPFSIEKMNVF